MKYVRKLVFASGWYMLVDILGLLLVGSLVPVVQAHHIGCGAVLGPGTVETLDSHVGPCDALAVDAAIRVVSTSAAPTKLDLGGFTVFCGGPVLPNGIVIEGRKAMVSNGRVSGCNQGVLVESVTGGNHTLAQLTSQDNVNGFFVGQTVHNNKLTENTAVSNGTDGFVIQSKKNQLIGNTADANSTTGFRITNDNNTLVGNTATANVNQNGFDISLGVNNKLIGNTATANGNIGFSVCCANSSDGFAHHKHTGNTEDSNGAEGFVIAPAGKNTLVGNTATNNGLDGIFIHSLSTNNTIVKNTSTGHGAPNFDMKDENGNCDANRWKKNTFGTANPDCIQ